MLDNQIKQFGFNPYDNIQVTLKNASPTNEKYKLNISSNGMGKPIQFDTKFNPESKFLDLVDQILDEMELLEDQPPQDTKLEQIPENDTFDIDESGETPKKSVNIELPQARDHQNSNFLQYDIIQSKLGKFKNTCLDVQYFRSTPQMLNQNQSKQIVTKDQNNVYRMHKIKAIKMMSDKDYLL